MLQKTALIFIKKISTSAFKHITNETTFEIP
jgi:hypothetical protein